jgi:hypothetical protein
VMRRSVGVGPTGDEAHPFEPVDQLGHCAGRQEQPLGQLSLGQGTREFEVLQGVQVGDGHAEAAGQRGHSRSPSNRRAARRA